MKIVMHNYIFEQCQEINYLLSKSEKESNVEARGKLFQLLEYHKSNNVSYSPLVNHLIRLIGIYPYLQEENCLWEDKLVREIFKVNNGDNEEVVLHIEQSNILKKLLYGESIAVSAPTSFGKSYLIDSFIAIKNPDCILIVVPTIALLNECRRRLNNKFSKEYKIITTTNAKLDRKNILILTQERALQYVKKLKSIDLLVIDEFYKASIDYDKERAPILQKLILDTKSITKQKYFLAPNINNIKESIFSTDIQFIDYLDFNTVFLQTHDIYKEILGSKEEKKVKKSEYLIRILRNKNDSKLLIYAGTYSELDIVSSIITEKLESPSSDICNIFSKWLIENYSDSWDFTNLIRKRYGIHSGQLHRPLAQIQIKLFEEDNGLTGLISTSSIVEGINTSAKHVIVWKNKNGNRNLNYFLYKNIIGRAGRMFKHFVGEIHLLEQPPISNNIELEINIPKTSLLSLVDESIIETSPKHQVNRLNFKKSIEGMLGNMPLKTALENNLFNTSDFETIINIKNSLENKNIWNGITYLNSDNSEDWRNLLFEVCRLQGNIGTNYTKFVEFIIKLHKYKNLSIPEQLVKLNLSINDFFQYERKMAFSIPPLIQDIQEVYNLIYKSKENIDLSSFHTKVSYAFLPKNIYLLEEYGLPRMVSKKISETGLINLYDNEIEINDTIENLKKIGFHRLANYNTFSDFDKYILEYFFDGV